jgi:hypothetical protein
MPATARRVIWPGLGTDRFIFVERLKEIVLA